MGHVILHPRKSRGDIMKSTIDFQKEEVEKLIDSLGLKDNVPEEIDDTDYFNAWNFGLRKRDIQVKKK